MQQKFIIASILITLMMSSTVFAQERLSQKTNIIFELSNGNFDDQAMRSFLNNVLADPDLDLLAILNPKFFAQLSNFSSRRAIPKITRSYYNAKLVNLLQLINENVSSLTDTDLYVYELRLIIQDSQNPIVIMGALELYAKIILENTPSVSAINGYTPEKLYLIDATDFLLSKTIRYGEGNVAQSKYLILAVVPYITQVLAKAPDMINHARFISNVSLITTYHNSDAVQETMQDLIVQVINLQLQ